MCDDLDRQRGRKHAGLAQQGDFLFREGGLLIPRRGKPLDAGNRAGEARHHDATAGLSDVSKSLACAI